MVRLSRPEDSAAPWTPAALALSRRLDAAQLAAHAALSDVLARVTALGGALGVKPPAAAASWLDQVLRRKPQQPASRLQRVRAQGAARAQGCTPRALLAEAAKHERCVGRHALTIFAPGHESACRCRARA